MSAAAKATDCEVGDLSGKWGSLDTSSPVQVTYTDANLPLLSSDTILGRSVTILAAGQRLACATIKFGVPTIVAEVTIESRNNIDATFRMEQAVDYPNTSPTTVLVNTIAHKSASSGHRWRVHDDRGPGQCDRHLTYNPLLADGGECSPELSDDDKLAKCEVGDLSGRMGTLSVPMTNHAFGTVNLPLSGEYSVMGRDLAIYRMNDNGDKKKPLGAGCGMIRQLTVSSQSDSWSRENSVLFSVVIGCVVVVLVIAFSVFKTKRRKRNFDNDTTTKGLALL